MKVRTLGPAVLLIPLLSCSLVHAQSAPGISAYQFSDGVHPTFDATFEEGNEREVTSFWRDELKSISVKVTAKKELIGAASRIPGASPDTLRILIAVERPKGGLYTTAHIAFRSTSGYVGPDSPERELSGCTQWVQQRTVTLRKQLAQAALDVGRRDLDRLQGDLDLLKRENDRAVNSLLKARERGEQAALDKEDLEKELGRKDAAASTSKADSTSDPDAEKDHVKEQNRLRSKAVRAEKTARDMEKKVTELQWSIQRNEKDQVTKQEAIDRQRTVVNGSLEKLQSIQ